MINWMKWEISLKLKRAQRKERNIYYVCMYVCMRGAFYRLGSASGGRKIEKLGRRKFFGVPCHDYPFNLYFFLKWNLHYKICAKWRYLKTAGGVVHTFINLKFVNELKKQHYDVRERPTKARMWDIAEFEREEKMQRKCGLVEKKLLLLLRWAESPLGEVGEAREMKLEIVLENRRTKDGEGARMQAGIYREWRDEGPLIFRRI